MSSTVTSLKTFAQGAKPLSQSEVNPLFALFRGNRIPIDPTAASAADLAYDIGNSEYSWKNAYIQRALFSDVTTAGLYLKGDSDGKAIVFGFGGVDGGTITTSGFKQYGARPITGCTASTASLSALAYHATTSGSIGNTTFATLTDALIYTTIGAVSLKSAGGRIKIGLEGNMDVSIGSDWGTLTIDRFLTGGSITGQAFFQLLRDGVTIQSQHVVGMGIFSVARKLPSNVVEFYDQPAAGTYTWEIQVAFQGTIGSSYISATEVQAFEY